MTAATTPEQAKEIFTKDVRDQLARAVTQMMNRAGDQLKDEARASIAAGGFGKQWQNAFRVNVYPLGKDSMSAAIYGWHNIHFSEIFETGGTVRGKPLLWLPLPTVPKRGKRPPPPSRIGVKLQSVNVPGKPPMLVGKLKGKERAPLYVGVPSVSISKKFDIRGVAERVSNSLPSIFDQVLR